ncbi:MAG TPA: recombinase family protein [Clostridiales bacterium]|nr:recombinase family protein [Clostridiales bacterium]
MAYNPKVHVIPAKPPKREKRVGIYCRVSTNDADQLNSLAVQVSALTRLVAATPQWLLVDVYMDIASSKTGASRKEFARMLDDCKSKKLEIIITKSISRFGRDTVETLEALRLMRDFGVRVIFEEENIDTDDVDSNLLISVMESVAQSENESRSENIRMGLSFRAANGTSGLYKRKLYGYAKTETGELAIDKGQAQVVRDIFRWYLGGDSVLGIIKKLSDAGIPSPTGIEKWSKRPIEKMLENEKYTGTVTLLDSSTQEYEYKIKDNHPPIITENEFRSVQEEKMKRSNIVIGDSGTHRSNKKYSSKKK